MGILAAFRREGILKTLRGSRELLQAFGVARLSLFGLASNSVILPATVPWLDIAGAKY
jgi:hypothetical protein